MLGLGTTTTSIDSGQVYKELYELDNYADLDINRHVEIDSRLFRPQEVPYLLGDHNKAKTVLNWEPKVKFNELAILMYNADLNKLQRSKT